jgi:hypothetical protein
MIVTENLISEQECCTERVYLKGGIMRLEALTSLFRFTSEGLSLGSVRDTLHGDELSAFGGLDTGLSTWAEQGVRTFVHVESRGGRVAVGVAWLGGHDALRVTVTCHVDPVDAGLHIRTLCGTRGMVVATSSRQLVERLGLSPARIVSARGVHSFACQREGIDDARWEDELELLRQAAQSNDHVAWETWAETVRLDLGALAASGPSTLRLQ